MFCFSDDGLDFAIRRIADVPAAPQGMATYRVWIVDHEDEREHPIGTLADLGAYLESSDGQ